MAGSGPLERLERELLARGLPRRYVRRLLQEWGDHREDLLREALDRGMSAAEAEREGDRRLGDPRLLASAALEGFRSRRIAGRHRAACMLIAPPLAAWTAGAGFLFLSLGPGLDLLESLGWTAASRLWVTSAVGAAHLAAFWIPVAVAAGVHRWGRGSLSGTRWTLAGCALSAAASSVFEARFIAPTPEVPTGLLRVGLSLPPDALKLGLALGGVLVLELIWRSRRTLPRRALPEIEPWC